MNVDDLRPLALFDGLSDDQLTELIGIADEVRVEPGDVVFREGEPADDWWVLLGGTVELSRHTGQEDTVVGALDVPGRWAGGFRAWDPQGVYLATGTASQPARLLRVPAAALRERFTAWFPFAVHLVQGLYGTARSIEATARRRGALVTLGTLAAGLAHEINNPAAAAVRAVDGMEEASNALLASLRDLAGAQIHAEQFHVLDELRLQLVGEAAPVDPLELADREEEIADWLEERDIPGAWTLAAPLAAAGVTLAWCERLASELGDQAVAPALEWVASTLTLRTLISEVKLATGRVSELVTAVKSYTQMDRASRQTVDVTEGIESSLVMLAHKLRDGVSVVREYGADVPMVDAFPGELNQLWTNLIDNAVDAMPDGGTLRLVTRVDGPWLVVEVADTGHGMSTEVQARAFDAFYTTKDVGRGTGLGLDISQRIVRERHHGQIEAESSPAGTTMRVRIPLD
jgi:signal transduction histidine kinase